MKKVIKFIAICVEDDAEIDLISKHYAFVVANVSNGFCKRVTDKFEIFRTIQLTTK